MSATEHPQHHEQQPHEQLVIKKEKDASARDERERRQASSDKHPLHQFDLSAMGKLYEECVQRAVSLVEPAKWCPEEWAAERHERKHDWQTPVVLSHKQRVYEAFARLAKESGEPMILLPNFDFGDMINFERFLDGLKVDGVNAIGRYKQYLNSRDIRKFEIDLVVIHPVNGILLIETKESDHFDNKKRTRARMHLNAARQSFEAVLRLILESKGLKPSDCQLPVYQYIALPNVREQPAKSQQQLAKQQQQQQQREKRGSSEEQKDEANTSSESLGSVSSPLSSRPNRSLSYLIKSDLDCKEEFAKWWRSAVEEPSRLLAEAKKEEEKERERRREEKEREEREKNKDKDEETRERERREREQREREREEKKEKLNKKDLINLMLGLVSCIRNNSILPVVYPESDELGSYSLERLEKERKEKEEREREQRENKDEKDKEKESLESKLHLNQPALNVFAEFFQPEHEKARSLAKCVALSRDSEKIRRTICLQTLWLLLNDSQKKISVVTSEQNKPYYEEFFARQRKVYNNLNNLRIYVDIHSCDPNTHTLKRDGEIWFFDSNVTMKAESGVAVASLNDILMRVKDLQSYWIFTEKQDEVNKHENEWRSLEVKQVRLDDERDVKCASKLRIKLPLRIQADLLIVGDMVSPGQLKLMYKFLKSNSVLNQAYAYNQQQREQSQYQQLKFNPSKKFRTVKFIRGGTIENLRSSLKMHDSIQAPVIFMHVGDEDLFKTRYSVGTIERVKELATLMREYCPKSFVALSTLMRRISRTENGVTNEVNKGITSFCKQTKESLNCYYMLNNHFEPDYHTQGGRLLTTKGLKLFADNILFTVDYFLIRNNKQH